MNDIEILTNENEIEVKGEKIVVTPYSWKNTIKMAKPLAVVLTAINDNFENLQGFSEKIDNGSSIEAILKILDFINTINDSDKVTDALQELICTGIKRDKEFVEDLDMEELFVVGKAVFSVNRDFFIKIMNKLNKIQAVTENPEK